MHVVNAARRHVAIRLYGHRLVEFRRERKFQREHVRRMQLIAPVAVLQNFGLSATVGRSRSVRRGLLRDRRKLFPLLLRSGRSGSGHHQEKRKKNLNDLSRTFYDEEFLMLVNHPLLLSQANPAAPISPP